MSNSDPINSLVKFDDALLADLCKAEAETKEEPGTRAKGIPSKWVYTDTRMPFNKLPERFRDDDVKAKREGRLSDADREQILQLSRAGEAKNRIAEKMGVGIATVYVILRAANPASTD